jgi:hypothetical protein
VISDPISLDDARLSAAAELLGRHGAITFAVGLVALLVGVPAAGFSAIAVELGGAASFTHVVSGIVVLGLFSIPLLSSVPLLYLGLRGLVRASHLRELRGLAYGQPSVTATELATRAGRDPGALATWVRWANERGAVGPARAATPLANRTSADPKSYAAARRGLVRKGVALGILAFPTLLCGLLWGLTLLVGLPSIERDAAHLGAAILASLMGVAFPLVIAGLFVWRSVQAFVDLVRIREIAAFVSSGAIGSLHDLGVALALPEAQVERILSDAMGRGLFSARDLVHLGNPRSDAGGTRAPRSWVGRVVRGTYRIDAPLGRGGMGAVFRATHLPSQQPCAFKILLDGTGADSRALARFQREAELLRWLRHPALVAVRDAGLAEDGAAYLVMELVAGETLEQRLSRQGVLSWPETLSIARDVGGALAAIHAAGLVHRDVKPSNIMLTPGPAGERAVLVDFGLAKRIEGETSQRLTSTGAVVGTPLYMSPEQARGEPLDARSDLFGLAVVLYETLAGVPPFFGKTLADVHARLLGGAPPGDLAPGTCPGEVKAVLGCALALRPAERFADVTAFLAALEQAAASRG